MARKFAICLLSIFAVVATPRAYAGAEMLIDNSAQTYAPTPRLIVPRVYYAPPPVVVVSRPAYYVAPVVYGCGPFVQRRVVVRRWH